MQCRQLFGFLTVFVLAFALLFLTSCKSSPTLIPEEYLDNPTYCETALDCALQEQCCGCPIAINSYSQHKEIDCDADETQGKDCPLNCREMNVWCVKNECVLSVPRKATLLGTDNSFYLKPEENITLTFGIENTKNVPLVYAVELNESVEELFGELPLELVTQFGIYTVDTQAQTLVPKGRKQLLILYTAPKTEGTFSYTLYVIDQDPTLQAVNESVYSQVNFYVHVNESYTG